jgi:hypothetical protein
VTERFPPQRNRSAHRRADASQVPAVVEHPASEDAAFDDDDAGAVFDESFVAAAPVHEPSAEARALHRHWLPDQRTDELVGPLPQPGPPLQWSVRPSHQLAALRLLPTILAAVCVMAATTALVILLR